METILIKAVQLILSLSILVIIHECGHFFFAKLFKVRVEKFYLFFNPWFSLFKYKPKNSDTEYGIGWLPLGGFVKISGMIDESMDKEAMKQPVKNYEFRAKPAWQRLLIMVGGVLMNFILAFFIYSVIAFHWGEAYIPTENVKMGFSYNEVFQDAGFKTGDIPVAADGVSLEKKNAQKLVLDLIGAKEVTILRDGKNVILHLPADFANKNLSKKEFLTPRFPFVVDDVTKGSPAQVAGLQVGDSIVGMNGQEDLSVDEIMALLVNKEKQIELSFYRNGACYTQAIVPDKFGKIGVRLRQPVQIYTPVIKYYNFFTAIPAGIRIGWEGIAGYVSGFKYIFTKEGAQSLGGFGAIGNLFPAQWDWLTFWSMTAFLSIILGVMNILPIPALDGGHILFLLVEVISGRKPSDKFLERAQMVGMVLLFSLLIYANGMDIFRAFFK